MGCHVPRTEKEDQRKYQYITMKPVICRSNSIRTGQRMSEEGQQLQDQPLSPPRWQEPSAINGYENLASVSLARR